MGFGLRNLAVEIVEHLEVGGGLEGAFWEG